MASTNYDKCIDALQWNYDCNHGFINMFKKWYRDDEFDNEQLIDEFVDEQFGYEESYFIEYLRDEFPNFEENEGQKLFNHLKNGLLNGNNSQNNPNPHSQIYDSNNKAAMLISVYIEEHCYSRIIPIEIIVLCATYFGPLLWPWYFNKAPSKQFDLGSLDILSSNAYQVAEQLYRKQCSKMPITNEILSLHVIGIYNNQLPLVTYLIDAYNRFRIETSIKIKKKRAIMIKDICADVFIKKVCRKGFKALGGKSASTRLRLQNMCIEAIEYLTNWRHLGKALIKTSDSIYVIQDSIDNYQSFMFECFAAVNKYIKDDPQRVPCQMDVTILPRQLCVRDDVGTIDSDDSDGSCSEGAVTSYEWDDGHLLDDLGKLLQRNNIRYICKKIHYGNCSVAIHDSIKKIVAMGNTCNHDNSNVNPRCCILFDARTMKLFVYQPPASSHASTFEPYNDRFVNESLFDNSIKCMIPGFSSIGIKEEHLFSTSFHCMAPNEVRTYLFIECFCTRFAFSDFDTYLRKFFGSGAGLKRNINPNMRFKDNRFSEFYNRMVNRNYVVTSGDERVNVIVKVNWRFDACYPPECRKYLKNENLFERARDENRYDNATTEQYTLSSRLHDFQFKKGQKYRFKIKCERHTSMRIIQEVQEIHDVAFGIKDADSDITYFLEGGSISDEMSVRHATIGDWKYGDVLMMEIDCTAYRGECYLSYFVNYKRIQTSSLQIKELYRRRYYPFIRAQRDNLRFQIIFP